MAKPLGIGIVGAGMVGQLAHLANFATLGEARVVALAELRPELGRLAAERFGVPRVYASHHRMLEDSEVEAVVVVTRRPATGPIVRDALAAGRHVLSEKPMAHSVAQAQCLVELASKHRLTYAVGYMKRHDSGFVAFCRLYRDCLQSGRLGRPILVRAWCHAGDFAPGAHGYVMTDEPRPEGLETWPDHPDWLDPGLASRFAHFLNVYSHDINALRTVLGCALQPSFAALDGPGMVAGFQADGLPVVLEMGEAKLPGWDEGIEITFEKGVLRVDFPAPLLVNVCARVTVRTTDGISRPAIAPSWSFRNQARAFVADAQGALVPAADGADGLMDLHVVEALWALYAETRMGKSR